MFMPGSANSLEIRFLYNVDDQIIYQNMCKSTKELIEMAIEDKVNLSCAKIQGQNKEVPDDLTGIDFTSLDMNNIVFIDVDLSYTNFSGSNLQRAIFLNVILRDANMVNTNLFNAMFTGKTICDYTDFSNSCFKNGLMRNVSLRDTRFDFCDVDKAKFPGCNFAMAEIHMTDMSKAITDEGYLTLFEKPWMEMDAIWDRKFPEKEVVGFKIIV